MKLIVAAMLIALIVTTPADAARKKRVRGFNAYSSRGTTAGACPCNGGDVCVGPRGGRYCITSGGNKRYGV